MGFMRSCLRKREREKLTNNEEDKPTGLCVFYTLNWPKHLNTSITFFGVSGTAPSERPH